MNFTTSFEEFAKGASTSDLMLYAGVGMVLWVLFKDSLSPVQKVLMTIVDKIKSNLPQNNKVNPVVPVAPSVVSVGDNDDLFFKLVVSWKQTRDLAAASGCEEAIKVADQMFPYLSPTVCAKAKKEVV